MEIPKYIVFRVDVMKKGTSVELTNITDDVEDVILKAEQTEPQKCDDCVWSVCNYNKVDWERAEQTEPQTSCKTCRYGEVDEGYVRCAYYSKSTEQTEPSSSEKPNNCELKICDTCRYYNSNIPCGSTPSACKEADKFAEEFVDGLKKLKPKDEPQTERSDDGKDGENM